MNESGKAGLAVVAILITAINACAQTNWTVISGGSPITPNNLPYYDPQLLTIAVGDQVRWNNQGGIHNVNGSTVTFPGNPQGFYNGLPDGGLWSWSFTFTVPGVYNYQCDGDGHSATQFGTITVVDPSTGLASMTEIASGFQVYPSPANEDLFIDLNAIAARSIRIIDLNGSERMFVGPAKGLLTLDVSALPAASYFVLVTDRENRASTRHFAKQ
ncbi:MAG: T9SS type A sorting domain-containing protein [Flavobacteriales bacterium]|nr:T9SS type A sorting domain-containing protein [Flavobacteriales bacterium]